MEWNGYKRRAHFPTPSLIRANALVREVTIAKNIILIILWHWTQKRGWSVEHPRFANRPYGVPFNDPEVKVRWFNQPTTWADLLLPHFTSDVPRFNQPENILRFFFPKIFFPPFFGPSVVFNHYLETINFSSTTYAQIHNTKTISFIRRVEAVYFH